MDSPVRSTIWVNSALSSNNWKILDIPDTNDVVAIKLNGNYGRLQIVSIYNAGEHVDSLAILRQHMQGVRNGPQGQQDYHILGGGDFNQHHPTWDKDEDMHLFTAKALKDAEELIDLVADQEMCMILPKGIPTLKHMVTKQHSRPDNVFCMVGLANHVVKCDTMLERQLGKTDHYPVVTILELMQERSSKQISRNFRETDWDSFNGFLGKEVAVIPISSESQIDADLGKEIEQLTELIQKAIIYKVPISNPCPLSKRWWTKDLTKTKKAVNRIRAESYKNRAVEDHLSHQDLQQAQQKYAANIIKAKMDHWNSYLENADSSTIWTANKYITNPAGDGDQSRIPTLKVKGNDGFTREVNMNEGKAKVLAEVFFPPKPATSSVPQEFSYPDLLPSPLPITEEQIHAHIAKLSPFKAPGPDRIPNIILQKSANLIVPYLLPIYRSIMRYGVYYKGWQESTTCILRKPGKPSYEVPKAYCPIALLCTMAKSIVSENLITVTEQYQLLPDTHFGGRPCRSTTDAVHLLVHQVK
jgi:Endonuclease-reverse transcriptase